MQKIELSKENKKLALEMLKKFFETERDESIGDLAAEMLLNFIIENIGPVFYNQAIGDAYAFMNEKLDDLYLLEKPI